MQSGYSGSISMRPASSSSRIEWSERITAATIGRHLDDALAMTAQIKAPLHEARTCVDYARMLLDRSGAGDVGRARSVLDRAQPIAPPGGGADLLADIGELSRRFPTA